MEQYRQTPIIQCSYNLNLQLQKLAANFPVNYRHTVGKQIATRAAFTFSELVQTNFLRQHQQRINAIDDLEKTLYLLVMEIRLAKDLKLISRQRHVELNQIMIDIKTQLQAWKCWSKKQIEIQ